MKLATVAAATESAAAVDFCNKSVTFGVSDAKPLLSRSFWDASHLCGTFGYEVMSVWRKKNLPDRISTWRLLQLRLLVCFGQFHSSKFLAGVSSGGPAVHLPLLTHPLCPLSTLFSAKQYIWWNFHCCHRRLSCSSLQVEILSGKIFFLLQTLITL